LSRIIRNLAEGIKKMEFQAPKPHEAKSISLPQFRAFHSQDMMPIEDAEEKARQAAAKAKAEALQEAEKKLKSPLQNALGKLEGILDEISQFRRELFKESESDIIELVRRISKRILLQELRTQPEILTQIVQTALEHLGKEDLIVMVFNPQDKSLFDSAKDGFLKDLKNKSEIEFQTDAQIPSGSALLKTETKEVDVRLEEMVDQILGYIDESRSDPQEPGDEGDKV